ncbi:Uncharacterised protein [Streptococcus pyogenes]|nr:Uncharacterised protein [Streptococcus pyogenes]
MISGASATAHLLADDVAELALVLDECRLHPLALCIRVRVSREVVLGVLVEAGRVRGVDDDLRAVFRVRRALNGVRTGERALVPWGQVDGEGLAALGGLVLAVDEALQDLLCDRAEVVRHRDVSAYRHDSLLLEVQLDVVRGAGVVHAERGIDHLGRSRARGSAEHGHAGPRRVVVLWKQHDGRERHDLLTVGG